MNGDEVMIITRAHCSHFFFFSFDIMAQRINGHRLLTLYTHDVLRTIFLNVAIVDIYNQLMTLDWFINKDNNQ